MSTAALASRAALQSRVASRLLVSRCTGVHSQQSIAAFTSRASKTNVSTFLLHRSGAIQPIAVPLVPRRTFLTNLFGKKQPQAEPIVANPKTTVTTMKEVPDSHTGEQPSAVPVQPEPDLNLKSERLGFSGVGSAVNQLLAAWPHIKTYSVWIAVGTGMIFVFKGGLNMVEYFATINFLDVGEVAFIAGLFSGLGLVACGWAGTRFLRLRPEPIFQHALKRINTDATVVQYMGANIQPSAFRAYSFVPGTVRMTQAQRDAAAIQQGLYKYWQPKRLQLFFQAAGTNGTAGMVSCEVEKNWKGDLTYNLLSVDLQSGERIVLEGDVSYQIYKGIIKLR